MSVNTTWEEFVVASTNVQWIKPFLVGLVGGIILAPIVAFSADWLVTTGTMNSTKIDLLATVCALEAKEDWQVMANPPELSGWDNRDARTELAKQSAFVVPGKESAESKVIGECAEKIEDIVVS